MIEFIIAFSAGFISFLSPCVLPLIPGYISYISGQSLQEVMESKRLKFFPLILFCLGFSSVFIIFGASASFIGQVILQNSEIDCLNGQLLFGSFTFYSKEGQQQYEYNNDLKIKFVKKYKKQILAYLKKNCDLKKDIKIKEITNFSSANNNYKTDVIINCIYGK